jgi:tRNA-specific 2-thiouridylase
VTADGEVVGTHAGAARYTVGQRRGVGVALGHPVYVTGVDAAANRVVVGPEEALRTREAALRAVRWPEGADLEIRARVQLRSRHRAAAASVRREDGGRAEVRFDAPQRAVTPGQSAVFYDEDRVIGGGVVADPTARDARG